LGRGKGALLQVMDLGLKKNLESLSPVLENRPTSLRTGTTAHDTVTGNCDDSYLVENLRAGTYTLALAVWDNAPNATSPMVSDKTQIQGLPVPNSVSAGISATPQPHWAWPEQQNTRCRFLVTMLWGRRRYLSRQRSRFLAPTRQ
jgi:hypothetical protein